MARPGNQDRGLYCRTHPSGKQVWYVRFWWHGREVRKKGGDTKEQAKRELRATMVDLERGTITLKPQQRETLAGVLEAYRPLAKRQRNYSKTQCFFDFWTQQLGKDAVTKITPAKLEQAQHALLKTKSPATVNRYCDWLRHVLNREIRQGRLVFNPFVRVSRLKEPDAPVHQYSHEQERQLMAALGEQGLWLRLAILTGLRQAEQFSIKKEWINWSEGYIQIPTSKAGRPRIVLLTDEIRSIVQQIGSKHPHSPYLFPSPRTPDQPLNPGAWYRRHFKPACQEVGLPTNLKWHGLRHTFGSRLAASGASAHHIKALGGWSTDKAANRYIHLIRADLLQVAEKLSQNDTRPTLVKESAS